MVARGKKQIPKFLLLITIFLALAVVLRLMQMVLWQPETDSQHRSYATPDTAYRVERGTIYDRNGTIMAIEVKYYACAIMLQSVESREALAGALSPILFMTRTEILKKMEGKSTYALIKQRLTREEYDQIMLKRQNGGLQGVVLETRYGRDYPQGYHAAQLIGFTGIDNHGLEGLEYRFDKLLSPVPGIGMDITSGSDIYLTIDMRIQFFADRQLQEIANEHSPDAAVAMVMAADTGEILAWASYPWYDLNTYSDSLASERLNRPAAAFYEPGSVFKIYTLAAILDIGQAATEEPFICDGEFIFTMDNGKEAVINCVSPHGEVGPREVLKYSCNGAIAHYALQTDSELFYEKLLDFGFAATTGIEVPGEIPGLLMPPSSWSGRSVPTIAFGQEIGVTALQMLQAATPLANRGRLLKPVIIRSIVSPEGDILKDTSEERGMNVLSPEVAEQVLTMMVAATEQGGTAIHAHSPGITTAAKTGTAQILDTETRSYSADHVLASTLALFPVEDPQYIIYVAVDNPKAGQFYGSSVAAPSIGAIAGELVSSGLVHSKHTRYLMIPGNSSFTLSEEIPIQESLP